MSLIDEIIILCDKVKQTYKDFEFIQNDVYPFIFVRTSSIAKILNISNIRSIVCNYSSCEKKIFPIKTKGGVQNVSFITWSAFIKFITKSRKTEAIDIATLLELKIDVQYYVSIETDIIKCILTTFDGNIMIPQYRVNNYLIDLYFPEYSLAIECDEKHHNKNTNIICDNIRESEIVHTLGCRFIRFSPNKKDFNLFKLLNDIYIHFSVFPRKQISTPYL